MIDGAKGLKSAVTTVFRGQVLIQRCQWHKRENVVSYLPTHRAEGLAWTSAASRRAAHLRGGEAGPESDAG